VEMKLIVPKKKGIWIAVNTASILLSFWTGYVETAPERLVQMNPDIWACVSAFVVFAILPIASVCFAKGCRLIRPSWSRSPFKWDEDPLQAIFVTTCCALGLFLGSLFRSIAQLSGFWLAASFGSIFLGMLLGQLVVYCRYYHEIQRYES
jgi:amino acid transporter